MYYFSIPDSGVMRILNRALFVTMNEHKDWFYDDFKIEVAYGCPPNCIWNGGRVEERGEQFSKQNVEVLVKFYKDYDVKYRLNFTNLLLKEEDLQDEYGNEIASVVNFMGNGEVATTLPLVAEYMQKNYSNIKLVWSTSTNYGENIWGKIKKIDDLSTNNIVVLPYEFNCWKEIENFQHPENLEILICDQCRDNCSQRKKHQELISRTILKREFDIGLNGCLWTDEVKDDYTCVVGRGKIKWFSELGIKRFKISGRESIEKSFAAYTYYFVLPEYAEVFYKEMENNIRHELLLVGVIGNDVYLSSIVYKNGYEIFKKFLDSNGRNK